MSTFFERFVKALDGCESNEQVFDVDNDRYIRENVLDRTITVTSARPRQSDYYDGVYAQVGFNAPDGSSGQFSIGGNGAWLPLRLQRRNQLPAMLTLYTVSTQHGPIWKWRRV